MSNKAVGGKSKSKLKGFVSEQITQLFGNILDFTDVALGNAERQKALRSKVLTLSNNTIRAISKEIDERYEVVYDAPTNDVIVVRKNRS